MFLHFDTQQNDSGCDSDNVNTTKNVLGTALPMENVMGTALPMENVMGTALTMENVTGTALNMDNRSENIFADFCLIQ